MKLQTKLQPILLWGSHWLAIALVTLPILGVESTLANLLASSDSIPQSLVIGNDVPFCYLQTSDRRLINLSQLCQGPPGTLSITNLAYKSNLVIGRVNNQSKRTARSIRVHYQVVDEKGNLIEQNSIEAVPPTLQPGESATFETVLPARSRFSQPYVTWDTSQ